MKICALLLLLTARGLAQDKPDVAAPDGLRLPVRLLQTIDVKHSKVGQQITMATTSVVKSKAESGTSIEIPRDAKVFGHVSEMQPLQGNKSSKMAIVADRVEWKGERLLLHAFIVGQLVARNSELGAGPTAIAGAEIKPAYDISPLGTIPAQDQIPKDGCARLQPAENPELGSEIACAEHGIHLDAGSTFTLKNAIQQ